jgi:hypothetical protein
MTPEAPQSKKFVKPVRKYRKLPKLTVPILPVPPLASPFVPSTPTDPSYADHFYSRSIPYPSPISPLSSLPASSTSTGSRISPIETVPHVQPRLRTKRTTAEEKIRDDFHKLDVILNTGGFHSVGHLLKVLFYNHPHASQSADPRSYSHVMAVTTFLQGRNEVTMAEVIDMIYNHTSSYPSYRSESKHDRQYAFSTSRSPTDIHYARPSLSTWATRLVGTHVHREIGTLAKLNSHNLDPNHHTQLRAKTNGRTETTRTIAWDDLKTFSISS